MVINYHDAAFHLPPSLDDLSSAPPTKDTCWCTEHLHQHWVRTPSTRLTQHLGTLYRRHFDTWTCLSASSSGSWRQFYFRGCRTLDFFTTRAYVTFALTVRVEMTVYLLTYCHASVIDLYLHTKFHWNRRNFLWTATYCQLQSHVTHKLGQK